MDLRKLEELRERRKIDNVRRDKRKRAYFCTFGDEGEIMAACRLTKQITEIELSTQRHSFIEAIYPRRACFVFYFEEHSEAKLSDLEVMVADTLVEAGLKIVGTTKYRGGNTPKRINQWVMSACEYSELEKSH